jgi:hypothetical protein
METGELFGSAEHFSAYHFIRHFWVIAEVLHLTPLLPGSLRLFVGVCIACAFCHTPSSHTTLHFYLTRRRHQTPCHPQSFSSPAKVVMGAK